MPIIPNQSSISELIKEYFRCPLILLETIQVQCETRVLTFMNDYS